jgi:serine/threonine-protein kinase
MMASQSSDQRDRELADLLQAWTDAPDSERASLDVLCQQHPHLADELRQLWGAVMLVDALAEQSSPGTGASARGMGGETADEERPPRQLGEFELLEELGRGGMGVVYRARQRELEREVAIKVMLRGTHATRDDQARFRSEAEAAARLDHPHIVPIYETGEVDGWRYFVMRLVEGRTLAERLREGPMPDREAAELVMHVAQAIGYAHRLGVIHRDLKPANILIDEPGLPYVTDFGLAKREYSPDSLTLSGAILGTPSYMAPEQATRHRGLVGPGCDLFSLGAILYALLTGRPPFQGATPVDTVLTLLEQDPLPPRLLNRRIHRDLEMIVLRCLQKPPELRYPSADALAEDLEAFLMGEPIAARSGKFSHVVGRLFRETHHATVLENWGVLWMWHAAVLLVLCLITNWLGWKRPSWPVLQDHWPYVALWGGGLAIWVPIFWALRHRAGPVTAVERQIAHAWGASIIAVMLLFFVESLLGLEVLTLSPVLGLICGMVFIVKAGILSGAFYGYAVALMLCSIGMAWMQAAGWPYGLTLFGVVSAASFFLPGLKYFRQSRREPRR